MSSNPNSLVPDIKSRSYLTYSPSGSATTSAVSSASSASSTATGASTQSQSSQTKTKTKNAAIPAENLAETSETLRSMDLVTRKLNVAYEILLPSLMDLLEQIKDTTTNNPKNINDALEYFRNACESSLANLSLLACEDMKAIQRLTSLQTARDKCLTKDTQNNLNDQIGIVFKVIFSKMAGLPIRTESSEMSLFNYIFSDEAPVTNEEFQTFHGRVIRPLKPVDNDYVLGLDRLKRFLKNQKDLPETSFRKGFSDIFMLFGRLDSKKCLEVIELFLQTAKERNFSLKDIPGCELFGKAIIAREPEIVFLLLKNQITNIGFIEERLYWDDIEGEPSITTITAKSILHVLQNHPDVILTAADAMNRNEPTTAALAMKLFKQKLKTPPKPESNDPKEKQEAASINEADENQMVLSRAVLNAKPNDPTIMGFLQDNNIKRETIENGFLEITSILDKGDLAVDVLKGFLYHKEKFSVDVIGGRVVKNPFKSSLLGALVYLAMHVDANSPIAKTLSEAVELLVHAGASLNVRDSLGHTPVSFAVEHFESFASPAVCEKLICTLLCSKNITEQTQLQVFEKIKLITDQNQRSKVLAIFVEYRKKREEAASVSLGQTKTTAASALAPSSATSKQRPETKLSAEAFAKQIEAGRKEQAMRLQKETADQGSNPAINPNFTLLTLPETSNPRYELDVPHDGSCLFYALMFSDFLTLRNNEQAFHSRFLKVFGEKNSGSEASFKKMLSEYDGDPEFVQKHFHGPAFEVLVDIDFRTNLVSFIREHSKKFADKQYTEASGGPFLEQMRRMQIPKTYGSHRELEAASQFLERKILIYVQNKEALHVVQVYGANFPETLHLLFTESKKGSGIFNHYKYYLLPQHLPKLSYGGFRPNLIGIGASHPVSNSDKTKSEANESASASANANNNNQSQPKNKTEQDKKNIIEEALKKREIDKKRFEAEGHEAKKNRENPVKLPKETEVREKMLSNFVSKVQSLKKETQAITNFDFAVIDLFCQAIEHTLESNQRLRNREKSQQDCENAKLRFFDANLSLVAALIREPKLPFAQFQVELHKAMQNDKHVLERYDAMGWTALHYACYEGNYEHILYIESMTRAGDSEKPSGIDRPLRDFPITPRDLLNTRPKELKMYNDIYAAWRANLIANGQDPNKPPFYMGTPESMAQLGTSPEAQILQDLESDDKDLDERLEKLNDSTITEIQDRTTVLRFICKLSRKEAHYFPELKKMLEHYKKLGGNINDSIHGFSPIHHACLGGRPHTILYLERIEGANMDISLKFGDAHMTAKEMLESREAEWKEYSEKSNQFKSKSRDELIRMLDKEQAEQAQVSLKIAAQDLAKEAQNSANEARAKAKKILKELCKVVQQSAQSPDLDKLKALVTSLKINGGSLNDHDEKGWAPLHYACYTGTLNTILWLRSQAADMSLATKTNTADQSIDIVTAEGILAWRSSLYEEYQAKSKLTVAQIEGLLRDERTAQTIHQLGQNAAVLLGLHNMRNGKANGHIHKNGKADAVDPNKESADQEEVHADSILDSVPELLDEVPDLDQDKESIEVVRIAEARRLASEQKQTASNNASTVMPLKIFGSTQTSNPTHQPSTSPNQNTARNTTAGL